MSSQQHTLLHIPCCTLFLDCSLSSNLLSSKIRDIPQKHKFETNMKPILEFYFGTSDLDELYKCDKKKCVIPNSCVQFKLQLDFVRDGNFIIDQILDLPLIYIQTLAQEFGLWKDRSFVLSALDHQLDIIKYTELTFNNDMEVMMTSVREFCNSVSFASQELLDNDEFVKFAILNGSIMSYFPIRFKKDRALVKLAIKVNSYNYYSIHDSLKNDKEIAMIALEEDPTIFSSLSTIRQNEKEIILKSVSTFKSLGKGISGELFVILERCIMKHSMDREFAIQILSEIGDFLGCFSLEIKSDREIVKEAIKNSRNKVVLEFVPDELKCDKEIVKMAVMQNGSSLNYPSSNLLFDKEIVLEALKSKKGDAFPFIPYELKKDREFLLEMISTRNRGIRFGQFSNDREIVLESVKINGLLLEFASKELKNDKEIVQEAVKNHKNASRYAGESLQGVVTDSFTNRFDNFGRVLNTEPEFFMNSWENDSNSDEYSTEDEFGEELFDEEFEINEEEKEENHLPYKYLPYNLKKDREITLQAIKKEKNVFKDIPRKLVTQDRRIALELVKRNGMNLRLLCYKFRNDRQVISEAIKQNRQALVHVPYLLRNEFN